LVSEGESTMVLHILKVVESKFVIADEAINLPYGVRSSKELSCT
jgi:hypothetical protein